MVKEKNEIRIYLYMSIVLAVVLGVYAQSIAYLLYNKLNIDIMLGLSTATVLSIILFLIPPILIYKFDKGKEVRDKEFNIYLGLNILIGLVITALSLFVFVMWLG